MNYDPTAAQLIYRAGTAVGFLTGCIKRAGLALCQEMWYNEENCGKAGMVYELSGGTSYH